MVLISPHWLGWRLDRGEHLTWLHLCVPPSFDRKAHGGSEGPDGGHRLPGNALKAFILSFDQTMRTFQTLTQGKKSLFFLGPGPCVRPRLEDGREGEGDRRVGGRACSDSAGKAGPGHTHGPFFSHLKICVRLARFLFVYFLWGRTGGRLMNKDINFQKNPKPNSILLPTLRAYIILSAFLPGLP